MLPFQPPFRNQNQVRGGNVPYLNQFPTSSSVLANQFGFNNQQVLIPTMGGLHSQNTFLSGLLAQQHLIQHLQNNFIASVAQQGVMPQLQGQQLNLLAGLQNPNLMSLQLGGLLCPPPLSQNLYQMMGFSPNGFLQSQNPILTPNPQLPVMIYGNSNHIFSGNGNPQIAQSTNSSANLESQTANKKLEKPMLPSPVQNKQSSRQQWPQVTHSRADGKNFSSNSSENVSSVNFKTKFNESKIREPTHMRFQKSQSSSSRNAWKKKKSFPRIDTGGQQQEHERETKFSENNVDTSIKSSVAVIYNESEVQRWREARRKNFPTRAKVELKLSPSIAKKKNMDSDAEAHMQELKEVVAKQAELGIRVAEIPSVYLEAEEQTSRNTDTRSRYNRSHKKGGRFRLNRNPKKLKFKKEPPLLVNHKEETTNPSYPEEPPSRTTTPNEASSLYIQPNRSDNKRRMFRGDKKNAKKLKAKKETTLLINHQGEGTNPSA